MNSQGLQNLFLNSIKSSEIHLCQPFDDVNLENRF